MPTIKKMYLWQELEKIPSAPGVYAWYYRHTFYKADIDSLLADLATLQFSPVGAHKARTKRVESFLQTFLFNVFLEEPYRVSIQGALKPTYEGTASHVSSITSELVERITNDPTRLYKLQEVLATAVPEFAAPIYIGLSSNLLSRIRKHKLLMHYYKEANRRDFRNESILDEEKKDHSFAQDVIHRGFLLDKLEVSVRVIDDAGDIYLDAENILNRINFPLCGRN